MHEIKDDERKIATFNASRSCFEKAAYLSDPPFEAVAIPLVDMNCTMPGWFFRADKRFTGKRPTIIINGGYDSTLEKMWFTVAAAATRRGYHCIAFDGPGQGSMIRINKIPFRPDWDNVITPVVDHLIKRRNVDSDKIILMGISFGGLLTPRAQHLSIG